MDEQLIARFWKRVDVRGPDECWPWTGYRTGFGYGQLRFNNVKWSGHRISYEIQNGPIAPNMFVCHRCDSPSCCNSAHLFLGTPADNTHDMIRKGRARMECPHERLARGERHGNARLTAEKVRLIRVLSKLRVGRPKIADAIGCSVACVKSVLAGKTWAHLP